MGKLAARFINIGIPILTSSALTFMVGLSLWKLQVDWRIQLLCDFVTAAFSFLITEVVIFNFRTRRHIEVALDDLRTIQRVTLCKIIPAISSIGGLVDQIRNLSNKEHLTFSFVVESLKRIQTNGFFKVNEEEAAYLDFLEDTGFLNGDNRFEKIVLSPLFLTASVKYECTLSVKKELSFTDYKKSLCEHYCIREVNEDDLKRRLSWLGVYEKQPDGLEIIRIEE